MSDLREDYALMKDLHKERVAKNYSRVTYAIEQFEKNGIKYEIKNPTTGHFHCWRKSDGKLFQFYAGTGKIVGLNARGINAMVKILIKESADEENN